MMNDPERGNTHSKEQSRRRHRPSRGKGLRTRSGCEACKSRRVKCDESRPTCQNCHKRQRECKYPIRVGQSDAVRRPGAFSQDDGSDKPVELSQHSGETQELQDAASESPFGLPSLEPEIRTESHGSGDDGISAVQAAVDAGPLENAVDDTDIQVVQALGNETDQVSPGSMCSGPPTYSAEAASLLWFSMLANDAQLNSINGPVDTDILAGNGHDSAKTSGQLADKPDVPCASIDQDEVILGTTEILLFHHFVHTLSPWLDIVDPEQSFGVIVASKARQNSGLMRAILALAARHLSLCPSITPEASEFRPPSTLGAQYYHETLRYLQVAMQNVQYLVSDELLATVLIISTYEMIDGTGSDWEDHLKGVFWIQRSQLIHGESEGLKKHIWWAWLRQDIWAAYKGRRKILSFYKLARPCSSLNFWELINRAFYLLGQCVNYASDKEIEAGASNIQLRLSRGRDLWSALDEWASQFEQHDRRLPTLPADRFPFEPIWIHPPAASVAVQVLNFARLLLLELMPATGGLRELTARNPNIRASVSSICGIAYCTTNPATMITSAQCLYGARLHVLLDVEREAINDLLLAHQARTGWPDVDIRDEMRLQGVDSGSNA